jgi:hypothetical protein
MKDEKTKSAFTFGGSFPRGRGHEEQKKLGYILLTLFVCVYVLRVSMTRVTLLSGDAAFVGLSRPCVWCAWLIFISCGTLLLMENENEKMVIGQADSSETRWEI